MFEVYIISNDVNDKVYIGQTVRGIDYRFKQHCYPSSKGSEIDRAIKEIGKEHFFVKLLDTATSVEELAEKEKAYIKKFDSISKGYNVSCGGSPNNYKANKKVPISITIDERYIDEVKMLARQENRSLSNMLNILVTEALDDLEARKK